MRFGLRDMRILQAERPRRLSQRETRQPLTYPPLSSLPQCPQFLGPSRKFP